MASPDYSGGNNPAVSAAMSNLRGTGQQAPATPNQLPAQQGPQFGAGGGASVGTLLAQALQLFVKGGASQEDTMQIKQFFEAFVRIAEESKAGIASQAPAPNPAGPQMAAASAQGAPQPGPGLPPA